MIKSLEKLRLEALGELKQVDELKELESWRVRCTGKKSKLTQALRSLASLPLDERRKIGSLANETKVDLELRLDIMIYIIITTKIFIHSFNARSIRNASN